MRGAHARPCPLANRDCLTQSPTPHQRRKYRSPALAPLPFPAGKCRALPRWAIDTGIFRTRTAPNSDCDLGTLSLNADRKYRRKSPGHSPRSWIHRWRKVAPRRKPSPRDGPLPGRTDRGEWKPLVRRYRRVSGILSFWRRPGPVTAENYGCSSMWRR